MNALFSPECARTAQGGKGSNHARCLGLNSTDTAGLELLCLCACHTIDRVSPRTEPPSWWRAERMRADWASHQFRQVDLAARYGVSMNAVRQVIYKRARAV